MKKYNEFENSIIERLKNYNTLKVYLENLNVDLKCKEESLHTISAPIAQYGSEPVGRSGLNISRVEADAERHIKILGEIRNIQININELETAIGQLERALDALDAESGKIVQMRYVCGYKWEYIAMDMHCSVKLCRDRSDNALRRMSGMIFGPKALPGQLDFVFFK